MSQITGARIFVAHSDCDLNACENGGICAVENSTTAGHECDCALGYRGSRCEEDINECLEGKVSSINSHS